MHAERVAHRTLLASPLALYDVDDVEGYCYRVLERRLRRFQARLTADDREDALAFLISTAWELSKRYDPTIGTFSGYLSSLLDLRLADWFRRRFGDSRYGLEAREIPGSEDCTALAEEAEPLDVEALAVRLPAWADVSRLTPRSQWILREIVAPITERGASCEEIGVGYGKSRKWTERLLDELRRELAELRDAA